MRREHRVNGGIVILKIRGEHLDDNPRIHLPHTADDRLEMFRTTIGQVITSHGGNHHVLQLHSPRGFSNTLGLISLQRHRLTCVHGAETARACAALARDHERCCPLTPTFPMIWTAGAFTNSMKIKVIYEVTRGKVRAGSGQFHPKPFW